MVFSPYRTDGQICTSATSSTFWETWYHLPTNDGDGRTPDCVLNTIVSKNMVTFYRLKDKKRQKSMCTSVNSSTFWNTYETLNHTLHNDQDGGAVTTDITANLTISCRSAAAEITKVEDQATSHGRLSMMKRENEQMKLAKRCKNCFAGEVNILLLPCRHLACCEKCEVSCKTCPMCNRRILGTVKTYLA